MKENYLVCNCKQVSYADIEEAMLTHKSLGDVIAVFEDVQKVTHCSTGCGGCHAKVMDIISDIMSGNSSASQG